MGTVGSRGGQRLSQRTGGRCGNTSEPWEVSGGLFLGEQREGSGGGRNSRRHHSLRARDWDRKAFRKGNLAKEGDPSTHPFNKRC